MIGYRHRGSISLSAHKALLLMLLTLLCLRTDALTTVYIMPVYEWTLVFREWRNPNFKFGSIWRPKMIADLHHHFAPPTSFFQKNMEIDGFDLRHYLSTKFDIVHLGDVFVAGPEPPNFVGSVLIVDRDGSQCPIGIPCFTRDDDSALWTSLLIVTPDPNLMEPVWASHVKQVFPSLAWFSTRAAAFLPCARSQYTLVVLSSIVQDDISFCVHHRFLEWYDS